MNTEAATAAATAFWQNHLQILSLPENTDARTAIVEKRLSQMRLPHQTEVRAMVEFLFNKVPLAIVRRAERDDYERTLAVAHAYGRLTIEAFSFGVVRHPIGLDSGLLFFDYFADEGPSSESATACELIGALLLPTEPDGKCGFRTFGANLTGIPWVQPIDMEQVGIGPHLAHLNTPFFTGWAKCREYAEKLDTLNWEEEWRSIQLCYPEETRFRLLTWVSPSQGENPAFDAVFRTFCWKYCLLGMENHRPWIQTPLINQSPFGTEIFIPAYMSVDFKRDFDLGAISRFHHAGGRQRQGEGLADIRAEKERRNRRVADADFDARGRGLKGDTRYDYIRKTARLAPNTDEAQIRRMVKASAKQDTSRSHKKS